MPRPFILQAPPTAWTYLEAGEPGLRHSLASLCTEQGEEGLGVMLERQWGHMSP
jgi:hypothetical protein